MGLNGLNIGVGKVSPTVPSKSCTFEYLDKLFSEIFETNLLMVIFLLRKGWKKLCGFDGIIQIGLVNIL